MKLPWIASTFVLLCAFGATAAAQDAGHAHKPGADAIAQKVVSATGDPTKLDELAFSFVVEKGGKEVARRRHVWHPKAGKLTVTSGDQTITLTHLHDYDVSKLAGQPSAHAKAWKAIAPKATPEQAAKAWGWFINDSYWLLMPSKLMDAGVHRALDEQGRLVLTFGDVGLTPGDRYALTIDPDKARIARWDFKLQSGRQGHFKWLNYQKFGPLTLSTRRVSDDGGFVIRFANVEATP